jgi:hypothetical protein
MKLFSILFLLLSLLTVTACSSDNQHTSPLQSLEQTSRTYDEAPANAKSNALLSSSAKRQSSKYLAYRHRVQIALTEKQIDPVFKKITAYCNNDTTYKCTLLHSSLNTGEHTSANIRLRILPKGIPQILELASQQGKISNRSTDVDDLQSAIVDNKKRLEMLIKYRNNLTALEEKSNNNINSLIKITKEIARVQSQIEYAQGAKARLLQRTQTDILNISLHPNSQTAPSFWEPILDALKHFTTSLSEGIASSIYALAYLLPLGLMGLLFFFMGKAIWRKTKK